MTVTHEVSEQMIWLPMKWTTRQYSPGKLAQLPVHSTPFKPPGGPNQEKVVEPVVGCSKGRPSFSSTHAMVSHERLRRVRSGWMVPDRSGQDDDTVATLPILTYHRVFA